MQRQFDMENEQDYTELFKLFSPEIKRIKKLNDKTIMLENYNGLVIDLPSCFNIKWGNLTYVDRPVDKSKWIGCLGWFEDHSVKVLGILKRIDEGCQRGYVMTSNTPWAKFTPAKRSEIKFVEDND